MPRKHFLILQGVATPFFNELGKVIQRNGHHVTKLNFCGGDLLFSKDLSTINIDCRSDQLIDWLEAFNPEHPITDIIVFGDARAIHQPFISYFKQRDVLIHVFEEGYFRPHWVTLERNGVNGFSDYMKLSESEWLALAKQTHTQLEPIKIKTNFHYRAFYDITYRLANGLLAFRFKHYRSHRPLNGLLEYLGWAKRFTAMKLWRNRQDQLKINNLLESKKHFFLFPLQLESDTQIHTHSSYKKMSEIIEEVLVSFAKFAPKDRCLVIKNHPLSTGIPNHSRTIKRLCQKLDIDQRVIYLESGVLNKLIIKSDGMVIVNSTSGTEALQYGRPVITLGKALFNLPGLTHQNNLDDFWQSPDAPDAKLFSAYKQVLMEHTQVNGDFYSPSGIALTIRNSLEKLGALPTEAHRSKTHTTILITGASQGIGASLAYHYAEPGIRLILVARNSQKLAHVSQHCSNLGAVVISQSIDINHKDEFIDWIHKIDMDYPIDLLITSAGITLASNPNGALETLKDSQQLIDTNLVGTLNAVNPIAERMRRRGKGQIAMVSSLAAFYGMPVNPIYSASKAAIKSYGEALRGLLKDQGVKVSVVCPGFVETDLSQQFPGERPFMISADKAAKLIAKGLKKNKATISFPATLALGMRCLQFLPFPIASFFMGLSGFNRAKQVKRK